MVFWGVADALVDASAFAVFSLRGAFQDLAVLARSWSGQRERILSGAVLFLCCSFGGVMELSPYIGLIVMSVLTAGFLVTMLVLSTILGPKNPTRTKQLPFECGSVSVGNVRDQRFNVRFYLVAMSFILFDIEVIFLYPWVVNLKVLGWPVFWAVFVFIAVITLGLVYEWKKGILDWNE